MDATDEPTRSADEQLGSPVHSLEEGWLIGVVLGSMAVLALARRRARRTGQPAAH